jgi:hypothetical protein
VCLQEVTVKFAFVIIETPESRAAIRRDRSSHREGIEKWMKLQARNGVLVGGEAFETERVTPVTVRTRRGKEPEVRSESFAGEVETLGGYVVVDVASREAAVALAKTWPDSGEALEVRPIWSS